VGRAALRPTVPAFPSACGKVTVYRPQEVTLNGNKDVEEQ